MATDAEVEKGLEEIAEYMRVHGAVAVQPNVSWKTRDMLPSIGFDGDEYEGLRVVELIRNFAEQRILVVSSLRRSWLFLHTDTPEQPHWTVRFLREADARSDCTT